jgi:hypothetical protein
MKTMNPPPSRRETAIADAIIAACEPSPTIPAAPTPPVYTPATFEAFQRHTQLSPRWDVCPYGNGIIIETMHVTIRLRNGQPITEASIETTGNSWRNGIGDGGRRVWEEMATDLAEVRSILNSLHVACVVAENRAAAERDAAGAPATA